MSIYINKLKFSLHSDPEEITFDFTIPQQTDTFRISMLLGPNGTGKSFALAKISEIFRDLEQLKLSNYKINYNFFIEYVINENIFTVSVDNYIIRIMKNNIVITLELLELPSKVLALSFLVNDKFLFRQTPLYEYLGVRQSSNATFTKAIEKKIVNNFLANANNQNFILKFVSLLKFLELSDSLSLSYEVNLKSLITEKITTKTYQSRKKLLIRKNKMLDDDLSNEQINTANRYLQLLKSKQSIIKKRLYFKFKLGVFEGLDDNQLNCIKVLQKLEFISDPEILIQKNEQICDFEALSSGEKNILFTLTNILAHENNNNIILLDEPEISLHPNWQIEYMGILRKLLSDIQAHVFVASHSHFLVSDMKPEHSTLHSFTLLDRKKSVNKIHHSTYAWSADVILYKVFHARSFGNHSIKMEIAKVLELIATGSTDRITIKSIYDSLSMITFDESDPMNTILVSIKEYLSNS